MEKLLKKLRLKETDKLVVLNKPNDNYFPNMILSEVFPTEQVKLILIFVTNIDQLVNEVMKVVNLDLLLEDGRLLIAYAKKGNRVYDSYVHRDEIFPALEVDGDGRIQGSNYKFNQMVSLDETFTIVGLKKVLKEKEKKTKKNSQSVADYEQFVPELQQRLQKYDVSYNFFISLSPGYQKGWARYVYSPKQEVTKERRFFETVELLKKGIKSK